MTILQEPLQSGDGHAARGWDGFGDGARAVRQTEAWEHETFAEEQARWERSDPEYARICDEVRRARERGGEASRRADEAKAEWDARVGTQRHADDDVQRADHAFEAAQTARRLPATSATSSQERKSRSLERARTRRFVIGAREGHHHAHTTFAIESGESRAPALMLEPVRDEPAARTAPRGERRALRLRFRRPVTRNPVTDERSRLGVE